MDTEEQIGKSLVAKETKDSPCALNMTHLVAALLCRQNSMVESKFKKNTTRTKTPPWHL